MHRLPSSQPEWADNTTCHPNSHSHVSLTATSNGGKGQQYRPWIIFASTYCTCDDAVGEGYISHTHSPHTHVYSEKKCHVGGPLPWEQHFYIFLPFCILPEVCMYCTAYRHESWKKYADEISKCLRCHMIKRRSKAIHTWFFSKLFQPLNLHGLKFSTKTYSNIQYRYTLYDDTKVPLTTEYSLGVWKIFSNIYPFVNNFDPPASRTKKVIF